MFDTYEGAYNANEESDTNKSFHPLTRTPRIVGVLGVGGLMDDENEKHTPSQQGSSVVSWLVVTNTVTLTLTLSGE